jgi:orotate phosphoribosyltransferase
MFSHDQIWRGIDRLAAANGYSPSGLAKQAGLDPTSFNKSKRTSPDGKPRWPSTESLSKILSVTGATMSDFISLIQHESTLTRGTLKSLKTEEIAKKTAKILLDTESVLFNAREPFILKSGRPSPVYTDCRRLVSFVDERRTVMDFAAEVIRRGVGLRKIDYIAGGETAGIPYGALIADRLEKPMLYVRKEPKGYGRMAQIEGVLHEKSALRTILVEDLQTDGGSKKVFVDALRKAGAKVEHAFVIFHYGIFKASEANMKKMGIKLHALCTWHDVLAVAKEEKYFDKATLESVEAFLNDPENWNPAKRPKKAS